MTLATATAPVLPRPRGDLSAGLADALRTGPGSALPPTGSRLDPFGDDLHVALHTCYELHYRGFAGVDEGWEWEPGLLALRADLEGRYLDALRDSVPGGQDLDAELDGLLSAPEEPTGPSVFLRDEGHWWQVREYFAHRSIYHHKEADPYLWVVPRLTGRAKAALVAVEFDEYGGGDPERMHSRLYADLLAGAGLDTGYLSYLDQVPAPMLALVDMMSMFGLHRAHRAALVGHFATVEITSPPGSARMVQALDRFDADPACARFYREHVEADAVHEQVMRRDVIDDLLGSEPEQRAAMVFGIQVTELLESRFADHVLDAWRAGRSSLLAAPGSADA